MTALAFLENYKRINEKFRPSNVIVPARKPFLVVYDDPIGPVDDLKYREALARKRAIEYQKRLRAPRDILDLRSSTDKKRTKKQILEEVSAEYGFAISDIKSARRWPALVLVRHICLWRMRKETKESLPSIGRFMRLDHTSVLHAVRRIDGMIERGEIKIRDASE